MIPFPARIFLLHARPTPLHPLTRLSRALGAGVTVWLKRDDLDGFGACGNKVRKLEFLLADAQRSNADCLATCGGQQSNHCRLTAIAGAVCGLETHLILRGKRPETPNGNLRLEAMVGARQHFCDERGWENVQTGLAAVTEELTAAGRRPYPIPIGGSTPVGALGYAAAVTEELTAQAKAANVEFAAMTAATGSGGTHAGLIVGTRLANLKTPVLGVAVDGEEEPFRREIAQIATGALALLGETQTVTIDDVTLDMNFLGAGYGIPTPAGQAAQDLLARTEGVFVEPVYTAKALAGLLHWIRAGRFPAGSHVLFWHTGGLPSLFA